MIPKMQAIMKIERAQMRLRVSVEAKEAKHLHGRLRSMFTSIEIEDWIEGNLLMVSFIITLLF